MKKSNEITTVQETKKIGATTLLPRNGSQPIKLKKSDLWDKWFQIRKQRRIVLLFRGRDFHGPAEKMKLRIAVEADMRNKKIAMGIDGDVIGLLVLGDR